MAHALATAHIGEISTSHSQPMPSMFLGRRWGPRLPLELHSLDANSLPEELLTRRVYVHAYNRAPQQIDGTGLSITEVFRRAVSECGLRSGSILRLPTYCPCDEGHALHVFMATAYDSRLSELDYWGLVDLRAVVAPPRPLYFLLPLPTIFEGSWLEERVCMAFPEVARHLVFFMNGQLVRTHCSPQGSVPLLTALDRSRMGEDPRRLVGPVMETVSLIDRCFRHAEATSGASSSVPGEGSSSSSAARVDIRPVGRPSFLWSVPTHLDSHAVTASPGLHLGATFTLIGWQTCAVDFCPNGYLSSTMLCQQAIEALGISMPCTMHILTLCPSSANEAPFVVLLPAARPRSDRFVLVDASRVVHPPLCPFWVQQVPETLSPISVIAVLRRACPSLHTMGLVFLDCRPIRSLVDVGGHVPLRTVLPERFSWDSLPSPLLGDCWLLGAWPCLLHPCGTMALLNLRTRLRQPPIVV